MARDLYLSKLYFILEFITTSTSAQMDHGINKNFKKNLTYQHKNSKETFNFPRLDFTNVSKSKSNHIAFLQALSICIIPF